MFKAHIIPFQITHNTNNYHIIFDRNIGISFQHRDYFRQMYLIVD